MQEDREAGKYQAIVFDLDGTVLDTLDDLTASVNYALRALGYPQRTRQEVRAFVGNGIMRLVERSLPAQADRQDLRDAYDIFCAHYAKHNADRTEPYPGIVPLLREFRAARIQTAVVSNKAEFATKSLCKKFFGDSLSAVIGAREGLPPKPDPSGTYLAIGKMGAEKARTLYVGDSDTDFLTAGNAGLDCVLVSWGFRDRKFLEQLKGAEIVDTPKQLKEAVFCKKE